jgi:hypothetical protein
MFLFNNRLLNTARSYLAPKDRLGGEEALEMLGADWIASKKFLIITQLVVFGRNCLDAGIFKLWKSKQSERTPTLLWSNLKTPHQLWLRRTISSVVQSTGLPIVDMQQSTHGGELIKPSMPWLRKGVVRAEKWKIMVIPVVFAGMNVSDDSFRQCWSTFLDTWARLFFKEESLYYRTLTDCSGTGTID